MRDGMQSSRAEERESWWPTRAHQEEGTAEVTCPCCVKATAGRRGSIEVTRWQAMKTMPAVPHRGDARRPSTIEVSRKRAEKLRLDEQQQPAPEQEKVMPALAALGKTERRREGNAISSRQRSG